ncbi:membrane protein [Streptomyces sulfonofaciens]|uniref:Membrane protein n=1 Tax=Streptomyces sulfonofaciens TaxID=68272 RepID=A0A919FXN9_9ACTN|nr:membrane protein [Streptomyces sulfonofaciens]
MPPGESWKGGTRITRLRPVCPGKDARCCRIVPQSTAVPPLPGRTHPVPLGPVFRSRAKDEKAAAVQAPVTDGKPSRDPQAPKGRPTPKRSQAQSQRRSVANTPLTRKDAAKRQREARRVQMEKQRQALAGGDERYLPARDKGPVRRFARDFVDSRFNVAEFFLPLAVVILVLSMVRVGALQSIALLLWLVVIILIVFDSLASTVRLRKRLAERFPGESTRGAVAYALMRSLQMRRLRMPKPQVKRGERP